MNIPIYLILFIFSCVAKYYVFIVVKIFPIHNSFTSDLLVKRGAIYISKSLTRIKTLYANHEL